MSLSCRPDQCRSTQAPCVEKAVRLIGEAAATGAKVIVFPEAFITGYPKGLNYGLVVGARDQIGREEYRFISKRRSIRRGPSDRCASLLS